MKTLITRATAALITTAIFSAGLLAEEKRSSSGLTARQVMEQVEAQQLATTDSAFSRMRLTSCRFGLTEGQVRCVEQPRVRQLESVQINTGPDNKDTKSLMVVLEPASERGVGMLSYAYDDTSKDNETWMYLSALNTVRRITASNSDDDSEPASLFGSEFTTEDQETGKLDDYEFTLLDETTYQGRPVWVIQSIPTPERARTSRYSKTDMWIDQERLVQLRVSTYDRRGDEYKRFQFANIERMNDVWMARSITVMNLTSSRLSNISIDAITFGVDIEEEFLTQRALTDQVFRERHLNALRAQTQ
ncbi:outer membrane lipoprotein-sorting protein [Salinispirillum sp. LH 10-3-1]|uniref:Outer membrane lipoprotein-sorting protein n=1 Tax=Salinispirillum sp. LH 10-3-1 TaxID=2952525 RepID=A0AB38YI44_9GAMM